MAVGPVLTLGLGAFTGGGVKYLPTLGYGTSATPASVDTGGVRRRRNRQKELAEREEAEIKMILQQVLPVIERGRRGKH